MNCCMFKNILSDKQAAARIIEPMPEHKIMKTKKPSMFKLITAILPRGKTKMIMPVVKEAGIFGATVLSGKGLCAEEGMRTLGFRIGPSREVLILITLDRNTHKLVRLLEEHGKLKDPGEGIIFVMNICQVVG